MLYLIINSGEYVGKINNKIIQKITGQRDS